MLITTGSYRVKYMIRKIQKKELHLTGQKGNPTVLLRCNTLLLVFNTGCIVFLPC